MRLSEFLQPQTQVAGHEMRLSEFLGQTPQQAVVKDSLTPEIDLPGRMDAQPIEPDTFQGYSDTFKSFQPEQPQQPVVDLNMVNQQFDQRMAGINQGRVAYEQNQAALELQRQQMERYVGGIPKIDVGLPEQQAQQYAARNQYLTHQPPPADRLTPADLRQYGQQFTENQQQAAPLGVDATTMAGQKLMRVLPRIGQGMEFLKAISGDPDPEMQQFYREWLDKYSSPGATTGAKVVDVGAGLVPIAAATAAGGPEAGAMVAFGDVGSQQHDAAQRALIAMGKDPNDPANLAVLKGAIAGANAAGMMFITGGQGGNAMARIAEQFAIGSGMEATNQFGQLLEGHKPDMEAILLSGAIMGGLHIAFNPVATGQAAVRMGRRGVQEIAGRIYPEPLPPKPPEPIQGPVERPQAVPQIAPQDYQQLIPQEPTPEIPQRPIAPQEQQGPSPPFRPLTDFEKLSQQLPVDMRPGEVGEQPPVFPPPTAQEQAQQAQQATQAAPPEQGQAILEGLLENLNGKTVKELKAMAVEQGLPVPKGLKKQDVIDILVKARQERIGAQNAVQERGPEGVLPRPQGPASEPRSQRQRMGSGQQRNEPAATLPPEASQPPAQEQAQEGEPLISPEERKALNAPLGDFEQPAEQMMGPGKETPQKPVYGPAKPQEILGFGGSAKTKEPSDVKRALYGEHSFVGQDVVPAAEHVGTVLKDAAEDIQNTFAPQSSTAPAKLTAGVIRDEAAHMARSQDIAEAKLAKASKLFDRQSNEQNIEFMDSIEHGRDQPNEQLAGFHDALRTALDDTRAKVQALGTGALEHFYSDYFPHIWKDPVKAAEVIRAMVAGKRPMQGSKGFLKQRTLPTIKDGIERGLEPVSHNPVDLALLKIKEMNRYIFGQRVLKEMKARGLVKYVRSFEKPQEGVKPIDDSMFTVYGPPTLEVKEFVDRDVYEGLLKVAESLGIKHERKAAVSRRGALGLSFQGADKIETKFATELSVLAHEIGHQLDHKYDLWDTLFKRDSGSYRPGRSEFREIAALTERGKSAFSRKEKMAQLLEAYIHAPEKMQEVAPRAYQEFEKFLDAHPELADLKTIKPGLALKQLDNQIKHGGLLQYGKYMAPENVANVLNNYLSAGLGKKGWFRAYRGAANLMNMAQLGMSGFHLGFTTLDAVVSKVALASKYLASGMPGKAALNLLETPISPITNIIKGMKLKSAWKLGASNDILDAMVAAGGRAKMEQPWRTDYLSAMTKAFRTGNYAGGALRVIPSIFEAISAPILKGIVPLQKMGVFADMARYELDRLGKSGVEVTNPMLRKVMGDAWDSVDNRLGQVVYDNLFWNKTAKDLLMATVRSVGWNMGTWRELGGGAVDTAKFIGNAIRLKKPEYTHRMAYSITLPLVVGTIGATINYAMTGQGPQEMKDYFFPRTGQKNADGTDERLSLPSYIKDVWHASHDPVATLRNKLHPAIDTVADLLMNKDFYNVQIRNPDDPLLKRRLDDTLYILKQFEPFAVRGFRQAHENDKPLSAKLLPFIGVTPAPGYVNRDEADQLAYDLAQTKWEAGPKTKESAARSEVKREAVKGLKQGDQKPLQEGLASRVLQPEDVNRLGKRSVQSPREYHFEQINDPRDAMKVYRLFSKPTQRAMYPMMAKKIQNSQTVDKNVLIRLAAELESLQARQ